MAIAITDITNDYTYVSHRNITFEGGLCPFLGFKKISRNEIRDVYPELFLESYDNFPGVGVGKRLCVANGTQFTNSYHLPHGLMIFWKDRLLIHYSTQAVNTFFQGRAAYSQSQAFGVIFIEGGLPDKDQLLQLCMMFDPCNYYSGPISQRYNLAPTAVLNMGHLIIESFNTEFFRNSLPINCSATCYQYGKPIAVIGPQDVPLPYLTIPTNGNPEALASSILAAYQAGSSVLVTGVDAIMAFDNSPNAHQALDKALGNPRSELQEDLLGRFIRTVDHSQDLENSMNDYSTLPKLKASIARAYSASDYANDLTRPSELVLVNYQHLAGFLHTIKVAVKAHDNWFDVKADKEDRAIPLSSVTYVVVDGFTKAQRAYQRALEEADAATNDYLISLRDQFSYNVSQQLTKGLSQRLVDYVSEEMPLTGYTRYCDDKGKTLKAPITLQKPEVSIVVDPSVNISYQSDGSSTYLSQKRLSKELVTAFFTNLSKVSRWALINTFDKSEYPKTLGGLQSFLEKQLQDGVPLTELLQFEAEFGDDLYTHLPMLTTLREAFQTLAETFTADWYDDTFGSYVTEQVISFFGRHFNKVYYFEPGQAGYHSCNVIIHDDKLVFDVTYYCHVADRRYTGSACWGHVYKEERNINSVIRPRLQERATLMLNKLHAKDIKLTTKGVITISDPAYYSAPGGCGRNSIDKGRAYRLTFTLDLSPDAFQPDRSKLKAKAAPLYSNSNFSETLYNLCVAASRKVALETIRPMLSQITMQVSGMMLASYNNSYFPVETHGHLFELNFEEHLALGQLLYSVLEDEEAKRALQTYLDSVRNYQRSLQSVQQPPLDYLSREDLRSYGSLKKSLNGALMVMLLAGGFYNA